jgi:hypothetical protein
MKAKGNGRRSGAGGRSRRPVNGHGAGERVTGKGQLKKVMSDEF